MDKVIRLREVARLLGISNREVQESIDQGKLNTVCGQVFFSDLEKAFPHLRYEDVDMCTHVENIGERAMANARTKNVQSTKVEDLKEEIRENKTNSDYWRNIAKHHEYTLKEVHHMLAEQDNTNPVSNRLKAMIQWIEHRLKEVK